MKRTVILTGATGKLGQNIINELIKEYIIIILSRNLEKASKLFYKYKNIYIYKCDLSKSDSIVKCCNAIKDEHENIYAILNNAAVDIDNEFLNTTYDDFFTLIKTNIEAPYILTKEMIPCLIKNSNSRVVNLSSNLALRTISGATEYSMSKAAIESFTRSIAVEFGKYGLTSNTLVIGGMRGYVTKIDENKAFSDKDEDYDLEKWKVSKERIPLKRQGNFNEYVNAISFLLSNKSSYINGARLVVDGGISVDF